MSSLGEIDVTRESMKTLRGASASRGMGSDTAKGEAGCGVCSVPVPGTCWLKVPWPTAGLLSVAASDFRSSLAPELCSAAVGLAGHGTQALNPSCSASVLAFLYQRGFRVIIWWGKGEKGGRLADLSGNCLPGQTPSFRRVCVYLG